MLSVQEVLKLNLFNKISGTTGVLPYREFLEEDVCSLAVDTTSRGNQDKFKTLDGSFYIKTRFKYEGRIWRDNLVEVIASQYAFLCNIPKYVQVVRQGICRINGESASYSEAFDRDGSIFVSFSRALGDRFSELQVKANNCNNLMEWFDIINSYYSDYVNSDQTYYLLTMMLLDVIIANEDRHLSNFGYLVNAESNNVRPSILFDFGLGLFEHSTKYYLGMPLDRAIKKIRIKPWGFKVEKLLDFLCTEHYDYIKNVLPESIILDDFEFPSALSRSYFKWVNERLGVKVDSL